MSCRGRDVLSGFSLPERVDLEPEGMSIMCLTMHPVRQAPTGFQCMLCLDSFETQQEADACRNNDGADSFSKAAAFERRQKNKARQQRELIRD